MKLLSAVIQHPLVETINDEKLKIFFIFIKQLSKIKNQSKFLGHFMVSKDSVTSVLIEQLCYIEWAHFLYNQRKIIASIF
jgi:hypothetical protein